MRQNKIFTVLALIFISAALCQTAVFAEETEQTTVTNELPTATFEASSAETNEVAELKKTLADLQNQLVTMKSGMQDLQAKWVESEMKNLQAQLAAIRSSTATITSPASDEAITLQTEPAPVEDESADQSTIKVTSLEDFVGFKIDDQDATIATTNTQDETEINSILKTADAEIAKLEAILAAKKALGEDEAAHAEVTKKIEELKAAREQLAGISIQDTVEKLAAEQPEPEVQAEVTDSSNIIANADSAVLFQFPRTIARTAETTSLNNLNAGNLTADVLASTNNFERSAAPKRAWSLFSATSLAIFATTLLIGIAIFVTWLVRNERQLLAATSRRFQQLDLKPSFDLKNHAKKIVRTKNNHLGKNIIQ